MGAMLEKDYDIIVIGGGPGGYVAALKAAELGKKVALVEADALGGTCLNRGCIPTKTLIHATDILREAEHYRNMGIGLTAEQVDIGRLYDYKDSVVEKLQGGIAQLLKKAKVTVYRGRGTVLADSQDGVKMVRITKGDQTAELITAESIIIATGSKPAIPPIPGAELAGVITSDDLLLHQEAVVKNLVIVGGGVIGCEFASVFCNLGSKVTILEALPALLGNMDKDISQNLKMILKRRGVDIHTGASVKRFEREGDRLVCTYLEKEKEQQVHADCILLATGRRAEFAGAFEDGALPETKRGQIVVDEHFETSIPGVFAIGDVTPGVQLAHVASAAGTAVAEYLCGAEQSVDLSVIPACVYTNPEIASVGLTKEEAKAQGIQTVCGKHLMAANAKTMVEELDRGFVQLVFEAETMRLLGAQLMCARATDMIGELATAIANRLTARDLLRAMKAHPTFSEGIGEAVADAVSGMRL